MRTEIVIPFAFDTAPMETFIQEQGLDEVKRVIREMTEDGVRETLPKKYIGYSPTSNVDWKTYFDTHFNQWLNNHAEEIIDEAALLMAMRAGRNKKWREVLDELRAERDAE